MTNFNIKNVGLTNSYQTAEFDPAGWKELGRTTLSPPTPTFEDDTFSSGWVQTGTSVTASGGTAGGTTQSLASNDFVEKSLGVTLSDTKWVAEFETNTASIATARSFPIFALTDSAGDINDGDTVWVQSQDTSGTHNYNIRTYLSGSTDQNSSSTLNLSYGTTYYNTLIRSTGAIITLNVYSDSARTTLVGTISITNASTSVGGLNTVATGQTSFGNGAETVSSTLDNVKIYNGITDVSGASDNILVSSLADKKYYMALASTEGGGSTTRSQSQVQMGSPPATATTPTYAGWAVSGGTTYHSMDSANSEIDFNAYRNTAGDRGISKSVGTLNSDTWVARFQLDIDTINKPDGGGLYETFSLNAVDSSVVEQSGNTFIGLTLQSSSTEAYFKAVHGVNTGNHSNQVTIGSNGSFVTGTYYVEITRLSATSATVKVFNSTGSDYSTGQIGSTATLNLGSSHTTDLQYFTSKTNSGGADNNYVLGSFKGLKIYDGVTSLGGVDTGSNYAGRFSNNSNSGVADTPLTSDTDISISDTNYTNAFEVGYIANQASEEKLGMFWNVLQSTALASNAPNRTESVGKWSHTTSVLDRINWFNRQTGDFAGGSELVILGWDPTDNQSENFWEELASVKLGSAGDTLDSGTFTAKKYLWFQVYTEGANTETQFRLNNDSSGIDGSSGKYASRRNNDGGSDSTFTNQTQSKINSTGGASHTATFMNGFIINNLANEKLIITNQVAVEQTGTGTAPRRSEGVTKWENTSAQVTSIQAFNNSSGDFGTESFIKVWGHN